MNNDYVFFGDDGITSTSANFIANQAREYIQSLEQELDVNFINSSIELINSESPNYVSYGITNIDNLDKRLFIIGKCKALIAWLREAIKAKEELLNKTTSLEEYCSMNNIIIPGLPVNKSVSKDDILRTWNIKERNEYYFLEAIVATYGKYIHPDGKFSKARKKLINKINNPIVYKEDGVNTIIKKYKPSISLEIVDNKFFNLQKQWREYQARFNSVKNKLELELQEITASNNKQYSDELEEYKNAHKKVISDYNIFIYNEKIKKSKLKIIIPNGLKPMYDVINTLDKD